MKKILVLTGRPLESRESGYDVRVTNLCAHLPGEAHLFVVPLHADGPPRTGLPATVHFASVETAEPIPVGRPSPRRHLRFSDDHFLELSHRAAFGRVRDQLHAVVTERGITDVVAFGGEVAELAATISGIPVLLDVCDSIVLTDRRESDGGAREVTRAGRRRRRVRDGLKRRRRAVTESRFPARFDRVITISDADSRAVEGRRTRPGTVVTVPNGVDEAFLEPLEHPDPRRGVAFWGNLAFAPNREALDWFVHEVLPLLRPRGTELCVVGPGAPSWLVAMAETDPGIVVTGYVQDLRGAVARYPVMVNPMRTGSGLKNKVLEAFGLGLAVVSTRRGVEALPGVEDGVHARCADDPAAFAAAVEELLADEERRGAARRAAHDLVVERYRWEVVTDSWRALFDPTGGPSTPHGS